MQLLRWCGWRIVVFLAVTHVTWRCRLAGTVPIRQRQVASETEILMIVMVYWPEAGRSRTTLPRSLSSRSRTNFECRRLSTYASYCTSSWREPPNHGPNDCSMSTRRNDSTTSNVECESRRKARHNLDGCERYSGEKIATAPSNCSPRDRTSGKGRIYELSLRLADRDLTN
jgi:hypothetical protein